jgi:hypothetical protein
VQLLSQGSWPLLDAVMRRYGDTEITAKLHGSGKRSGHASLLLHHSRCPSPPYHKHRAVRSLREFEVLPSSAIVLLSVAENYGRRRHSTITPSNYAVVVVTPLLQIFIAHKRFFLL